jgi:monovalent cation:H+ antiporter-2, CPA2 family
VHLELFALGTALLAAVFAARLGRGLGLPTIPFFILAGIALGPHSPGPALLENPEELELLAVLGLVLLLFHLGLEFSLNDLLSGGRQLLLAGGAYVALNFSAGIALGWWFDWGTREIFVIAGMIGTSSTAIVTKLLVDLGRLGNRETRMILGIIVVEDVFLAFYLALLQPILSGDEGALEIAQSTVIAFAFLIGLFALARWGARIVQRLIATGDEEILTVLFVGFAVFVAGLAEVSGASDAIGALLAGMVVAATSMAHRVHQLVVPLRDVFASIFFFWFGMTIAPADMGSVAVPVLIGVLVTFLFNVIAATVAARIYGYGQQAAANAALMLVSRGEFELILASLAIAAGLDERVALFAALYVLLLAILSPLMSTRSEVLARLLPARLFPAADPAPAGGAP